MTDKKEYTSPFSFEYFLVNLSQKYGLSKKDVLTDWKQFLDQIDESGNDEGKENLQENKDIEKIKDNEKEGTEKKGEKCIYVFVRGKNKGNCCNGKTKKDSSYCVKHIKNIKNKNKEEEKAHEEKKENEKTEDVKDIKDNDPPRKKRIAIQRDPYTNKFVHLSTQLVFFSKQEPVIYAKLIDGIELKPLTEEDILVCKSYNFSYDTEKIKEEIKV